MENSTAKTERQRMRDVAMAQSYVRDIGGVGNWKTVLKRTFDELVKMFPHEDEPDQQWTERRVRGFLSGDAATVQFFEMLELHLTAEKAKAERELLAKARKEHADFIAKTTSLRALLERQDEDFHRPQVEGLGGVMGGVDRPGTEG